MYSKKGDSARSAPVVPKLDENEHPVDWLERNLKYDPWENGTHYIAGIGFPNGYLEESRNTTGSFVFGACPDVETLLKDMLGAHKIKDMLRRTEENTIIFWHPDVTNAPRLFQSVIDDAPSLMNRSIYQAMAGPSDDRPWKGRPVSDLVQGIFCGHLNDENRKARRRLKYETPGEDDREQD
jgi:hypothetical protein